MESKKLVSKLAIVLTCTILVFCFIPIAQAGTPPFIQELPYENNLRAPLDNLQWGGEYGDWWEFDSTENLYFRIGAVRSIEEMENDWWPMPPWDYRLYINGEEIKLQRYTRPGYNGVYHPPVAYFWYHIFGPNYFIPGEDYLLKLEFWVKSPYQGDGLNHWRIYEDYWEIYAPMPKLWSFEYYLNIY